MASEIPAAKPTSPGTGDERLRELSFFQKTMRRPELGAVVGTILVMVFFAVVAGTAGCSAPRAS